MEYETVQTAAIGKHHIFIKHAKMQTELLSPEREIHSQSVDRQNTDKKTEKKRKCGEESGQLALFECSSVHEMYLLHSS